ncbi:hypothetical protein [Sphaerisporangium aureirubrum]|uniref:AAA+ ATPase domain-containing protein n=1 Tax=Sphaerisporangium aureirubrum TaxID=1544736 RepID=A0ABW1NRB5_9ACTN
MNLVQYINDYFRATFETKPSVISGSGGCLFISGEYGIGKTHLAQIAWNRISAHSDDTVHRLLLDVPRENFLTMYREYLIDQIDHNDLFERVEDYYRYIVAAEFTGPDNRGSADPIAEGLKRRELDPQPVVQKLGLVESTLRADLHRKLRLVTEARKFSVALSLILDPDYSDAVWEWLQGHPPSTLLRERGVTEAIDSDRAALDALGVLAFVYGRIGHRMAFVVDDLHVIMSDLEERRVPFLQAFERLVNVFIDVGGLLVVCGTPEVEEALSRSTRDRMQVIRPNRFTAKHTEKYIEDSMPENPSLFAPGAAAYITELADGLPRRILQLIDQAVEIAARNRSRVSDATVRAAVRAEYEQVPLDEVRRMVWRTLEAEGRPFSADQPAGEGGGAIIDAWMPIGTQAAVAVIVVGALLISEQIPAIDLKVSAARSAVPDCEVILVVNGYVAASLRTDVSFITGRQPLVFESRGFPGEFREATRAVIGKVENALQEDVLAVVKRQVDRIGLQQAYGQTLIEQLAGMFDTQRAESDRRLNAIQGELAELSRSAAGSRPGQADGAPVRAARPPGLPDDVRMLFDTALDAVEQVSDVGGLFRAEFDAVTAEPPASGGGDMPLSRLLTAPEMFRSFGVAMLLRRLIETFRDSVGEWFGSIRATGAGGRAAPTVEADLPRLLAICRTYDETVDVLPLFRLNNLIKLMSRSREPEGPAYPRSVRITEALDNLGGRVYDGARRAIGI